MLGENGYDVLENAIIDDGVDDDLTFEVLEQLESFSEGSALIDLDINDVSVLPARIQIFNQTIQRIKELLNIESSNIESPKKEESNKGERKLNRGQRRLINATKDLFFGMQKDYERYRKANGKIPEEEITAMILQYEEIFVNFDKIFDEYEIFADSMNSTLVKEALGMCIFTAYRLAYLYRDNGEKEKAGNYSMQAYNYSLEFLNLAPDERMIRAVCAIAAQSLRLWNEGLKHAEMLLPTPEQIDEDGMGDNDKKMFGVAALCSLKLGNLEGAKLKALQILEEYPTNFMALGILTEVYYKMRKYDESLDCVEKFLEAPGVMKERLQYRFVLKMGVMAAAEAGEDSYLLGLLEKYKEVCSDYKDFDIWDKAIQAAYNLSEFGLVLDLAEELSSFTGDIKVLMCCLGAALEENSRRDFEEYLSLIFKNYSGNINVLKQILDLFAEKGYKKGAVDDCINKIWDITQPQVKRCLLELCNYLYRINNTEMLMKMLVTAKNDEQKENVERIYRRLFELLGEDEDLLKDAYYYAMKIGDRALVEVYRQRMSAIGTGI